MTKEQAIAHAKRVKEYYPFRVVHIEQDQATGEWEYNVGKTMARANAAARAGKLVYIVTL